MQAEAGVLGSKCFYYVSILPAFCRTPGDYCNFFQKLFLATSFCKMDPDTLFVA